MIHSRVCRISLHCQALSREGPDVKPGRGELNLSACNFTTFGTSSVILHAEYNSESYSCPALGHAVGSLHASYFLVATTTFPVQFTPGAPGLMVPGRENLYTQSSLQRLELQTSLFCQIIFQKDCVVPRACSLSCWEASQKCSAGERQSPQNLFKKRLRY